MRAQLLATEHWSLLASRSTTQSEVLSRIGMLLNLVSAALVSLALVGQATRFSNTFVIFAIAVLAIVTVTGLLTQVRVMNVGHEDLMYVLAMNRLRAAYVELDPGIDRALMASRFDDRDGLAQTYYFLQPKRGASQFLGSSVMFTIAVNSTLCGLLAAAIAGVWGAGTPALTMVGAFVGLGFAAWSAWRGGRRFQAVWRDYVRYSPHPRRVGGRPAHQLRRNRRIPDSGHPSTDGYFENRQRHPRTPRRRPRSDQQLLRLRRPRRRHRCHQRQRNLLSK